MPTVAAALAAVLLLQCAPPLRAQPAPPPREEVLLGSWCSPGGQAFFEEMSFTIEDGQLRFRSWLHHRPAAFGSWALQNGRLVLTTASGSQTYSVEAVSSSELVLRQAGEPAERYVRSGCRVPTVDPSPAW